MRRHSSIEIKDSWRITLLSVLVGLVILVILLIIGFPPDIFFPLGTNEWLRALLTLAFILCASFALVGPQTALEDYEVRTHTGGDAIFNPVSYMLSLITGLGVLFCILLALAWITGLLGIPILQKD